MNQVLCVLPTTEITFAVFAPIVLATRGIVPFDANPGPGSIVNLTNKSDGANMRIEADPRPNIRNLKGCHESRIRRRRRQEMI